MTTWRAAMTTALYGPDGFFVTGAGPAAHFRTSAHTSAFAAALATLVARVDAALGHPPVLDVVDVGAGRGELLSALAARIGHDPAARTSPGVGAPLARRVRLTAVEKADRPVPPPAGIRWRDDIPDAITGLLVATEWLDNVPLDLAVRVADGWRYLLVDPATGTESVGDPVDAADRDWLHRWWSPAGSAGTTARAELGRPRDGAWAGAVGHLDRGLALAVDYGHLRGDRPVLGTLTGYRSGREVPPIPDGSCDLTAHVAFDSVAAAGTAVARQAYLLISQREALRALGTDGRRPPLSLAATDPAGYVRALAAASEAADLLDPGGLGAHHWLLQPVGLDPAPLLAADQQAW